MPRCLLIILIVLNVRCQEHVFDNQRHNPVYTFNAYWQEIDRHYSFFTYHHLDWDSVYEVTRPLVDANISADSLFQILSHTTNVLHDAHTNVYAPQGVGGNTDYFEAYPLNQITLAEEHYFDTYTTGRIFDYGMIRDAPVGYIKIKTFEGAPEDFEQIGAILKEMQNTEKLIIDVRGNLGGKIANTHIITSRLADTVRYYGQYRTRNGAKHDDFTAWTALFVSPASATIRVTQPVTLLTNRRSYSATEWFVLAARTLPHIQVVGDTTGGGSAIPVYRELPNGWLLRIANTQLQTLAGHDFQNTGLYPDVPLWISAEDEARGVDTILEYAMR